jgi:hypothetical protein
MRGGRARGPVDRIVYTKKREIKKKIRLPIKYSHSACSIRKILVNKIVYFFGTVLPRKRIDNLEKQYHFSLKSVRSAFTSRCRATIQKMKSLEEKDEIDEVHDRKVDLLFAAQPKTLSSLAVSYSRAPVSASTVSSRDSILLPFLESTYLGEMPILSNPWSLQNDDNKEGSNEEVDFEPRILLFPDDEKEKEEETRNEKKGGAAKGLSDDESDHSIENKDSDSDNDYQRVRRKPSSHGYDDDFKSDGKRKSLLERPDRKGDDYGSAYGRSRHSSYKL